MHDNLRVHGYRVRAMVVFTFLIDLRWAYFARRISPVDRKLCKGRRRRWRKRRKKRRTRKGSRKYFSETGRRCNDNSLVYRLHLHKCMFLVVHVPKTAMSIRCTIGRCTLHSPHRASILLLHTLCIVCASQQCRMSTSGRLFRWKWNMPRTTISAGQTSSMECHSFAITVACVHCRKCIAYAVWNTTARARDQSRWFRCKICTRRIH